MDNNEAALNVKNDTSDFHTCRGFICHGNHMESGHYIAYLSWSQTPRNADKVRECWLFTPEGKRVCYFFPKQEIDFFPIYHDFDEVIGAEVSEQWLSDDHLVVAVNAKDGTSIDIKITISEWQDWQHGSIESITETNKKFRNTPEKIGICRDVDVVLNGTKLGSIVIPDNPIYIGKDPLPNQPIINKCKHELEP